MLQGGEGCWPPTPPLRLTEGMCMTARQRHGPHAHRRRTKHAAAQQRSCDPSPDVDVIPRTWRNAGAFLPIPTHPRAIDVICTSSRQWLLRLCALRCNPFEHNKLKLMCRHEAWEKTHRSIVPSWSRRHKSGGGNATGRRGIGIAASCARCIQRPAAKRRCDRAQWRLRTQHRSKRQE